MARVCSSIHVNESFSTVKASVNTAELNITKNVASISVCAFEMSEHVTIFVFVYCFKTTTCLCQILAEIHLPSAVVSTLFPTQIKWHLWHLVDNYLLNPNSTFPQKTNAVLSMPLDPPTQRKLLDPTRLGCMMLVLISKGYSVKTLFNYFVTSA